MGMSRGQAAQGWGQGTGLDWTKKSGTRAHVAVETLRVEESPGVCVCVK